MFDGLSETSGDSGFHQVVCDLEETSSIFFGHCWSRETIFFVFGEIYELVLSNGVTFSLGLKGVVVDRVGGEVRARPGIVLFEGGKRRTGCY